MSDVQVLDAGTLEPFTKKEMRERIREINADIGDIQEIFNRDLLPRWFVLGKALIELKAGLPQGEKWGEQFQSPDNKRALIKMSQRLGNNLMQLYTYREKVQRYKVNSMNGALEMLRNDLGSKKAVSTPQEKKPVSYDSSLFEFDPENALMYSGKPVIKMKDVAKIIESGKTPVILGVASKDEKKKVEEFIASLSN